MRCGWVTEVGTDLTGYHDREWGTPVHDEAALFEALVLTYFENGLSWAVVFNKREALRRAFADFDPAAVATMTDRDVDLLMKDHTIIRNRAKIEATVHNARLLTSMSLNDIAWQYRPRHRHPLRQWSDGRSQSPESQQLATATAATEVFGSSGRWWPIRSCRRWALRTATSTAASARHEPTEFAFSGGRRASAPAGRGRASGTAA